MKEIIEILKSSIEGELQAKKTYDQYANAATQNSLQTISNLFRAVSFAESVHLQKHVAILSELTQKKIKANIKFFKVEDTFTVEVNSTSVNLLNSQVIETYEFKDKYKNFKLLAKKYGYDKVETHFSLIRLSEKSHAETFSRFLKQVNRGKIDNSSIFFVCKNYGNLVIDQPSKKCSICGKDKVEYVEFS